MLIQALHSPSIQQSWNQKERRVYGRSFKCLFVDFAFDHIVAAGLRSWPAWSFRLRLSLRIELLAQCMERLLHPLAGLLDAVDVIALSSRFELIDLALDILAIGP